jgi:hypothetical protein
LPLASPTHLPEVVNGGALAHALCLPLCLALPCPAIALALHFHQGRRLRTGAMRTGYKRVEEERKGEKDRVRLGTLVGWGVNEQTWC